jgi:uncharacterized protein Veg
VIGMGIYRSEIADLRKNIEDNIGQKIIIKESIGKRSKPQEKSATIENVYNSYFRVKFDGVERVGSYNYTDLAETNNQFNEKKVKNGYADEGKNEEIVKFRARRNNK